MAHVSRARRNTVKKEGDKKYQATAKKVDCDETATFFRVCVGHETP